MAAPQASLPAAEAPPCHQAEEAQANLCRKHCSDAERAQPVTAAGLPDFAPDFIACLPLALEVRGRSDPRASPALLRATSPPSTIRNCCLRI